MDKFTQLVEDLKSGKLTMSHVQMAVRAYVRESKHIPDGTKDLLAGKGEGGGLIYKQFQVITETIGAMELAYRRGSDRLTRKKSVATKKGGR